MTGSEHTTSALVCAALQQVGYQRPLPRVSLRLCPKQAYLTTRLPTDYQAYYDSYYPPGGVAVPGYNGTSSDHKTNPPYQPNHQATVVSCYHAQVERVTHALFASHRASHTPSHLGTRVGWTRPSSQPEHCPRLPRRGPSLWDEGRGRFPIARQRLPRC